MSCTRRFRTAFEPLEERQLLAVSVVPLGFSSVEGESYDGNVGYFTSNDPGPQSLSNYSATVTWGDGTTTAGTITTTDPSVAGQFDVAAAHTYAEEGNYTVRATVGATRPTPPAIAAPRRRASPTPR